MTRLSHSLGVGFIALASAALGTACGGGAAAGGGADDPSGSGKQGKHGKTSGGDEAGGGGDTAEAEPTLPLPKAGAQGEEKRSMSAEVTLVLEAPDGSAGGMSEKSFSLAEDRRVMIETVGDRAVTKVSVLYGKREARGLEGWSTLPTENNGYTVEGEGGTPTVLQNGKNPASSEEAKVVLAEYGYVGGAQPLLVAIERAKGGEAQPLDADGQVALLGYNPEITIDSAEVTFGSTEEVGGRSSLAVEVTIKGSLPDGTLSYAFELSGPAQVDATTGWVTDLSLAGKLVPKGKLKVKNRELTAGGKGTVEMKRTSSIK